MPTAKSLALCVLLTSCQSLTVSDDMVLFDFPDVPVPQDQLHLPYVVTTPVTIHISETSRSTPFTGWTLESADPAVFSVGEVESSGYTSNGDQRYSAGAKCRAESAGKTRLTLRDEKGDARKEFEVVVQEPDSVVLVPGTWPESVGVDKVLPENAVEEVRVLAGARATYMVSYSRAGKPLYGNASLGLSPTGLATVKMDSKLFLKQDFVHFDAVSVGSGSVDLKIGSLLVRTLRIEVVPSDSLSRLQLTFPSESGAKHQDRLTGICRAFDAAGGEVFGIQPKWDLDGMPQTSYQTDTGDLYTYDYSKDIARTVTAKLGALQASATIHASSGWIRSSNTVTW